MARILLLIVLVYFSISIQISNARHIKHERFIQRWFKWRLPGLEVERWKVVEKHQPAKRDAPPISNESESESGIEEAESLEKGTDDLSRLPAMSKESSENEPPELVRVPLEKSIVSSILSPKIGENRFLEEPEKLLTNIGLSEGINDYLQSSGGVLPVIPQPEKELEGPLKLYLPVEEREIKLPPPLLVPAHFLQEVKKVIDPPLFKPEIKEPEKVEIVHVEEHEHGPPIIEIPPPPQPPPPPHPEVIIPHVVEPEIKPIELPPEVHPIPAPPLPPIFKPEIKPPEIVDITHVVQTEVKPPEFKPLPPLAGPIAAGKRWMFFFSDMILHALSEIIAGARSGFVFTTATEE